MKPTILKLSAMLLLFATLGAGCQKDDELFEIQIGDKNAVIQKEVDGIEFKFCLLNEAGEPATVFNEGENFTFQFSFTNHTTDTIIVLYDFVNDDFFRVFSITNQEKQDLGKPYTSIWCEFVGIPMYYKLKPTETGGLQCPWVFNVEQDTSPFCVSESKDYLQIGRYSTNFSLHFSYKIEESEHTIRNKDFKINFEIK